MVSAKYKPAAKLVPIGQVSAELVARRRQAMADLEVIGRRVVERTGGITRDEILEWVREGRK